MGMFDNFFSFQTRAQRAAADDAEALAAENKLKLQDLLSAKTAQAQLGYGVDPRTGIAWDAPKGPSGTAQAQDAQGNWQTYSLLGDAPKPPQGSNTNLLNPNLKPISAADDTRGQDWEEQIPGGPSTQELLQKSAAQLPAEMQAYADHVAQLRKQADPDTAIKTDQMNARLAPLAATLSPDEQQLLKADPQGFLKRKTETAMPMPTEFESGLRAAGLKPGTPEWDAAFAAKRDKETYIPNKDPNEIAKTRAETDAHLAAADHNRAQSKLLEESGLDDDTMERMYQQWKGGQKFTDITGPISRGANGAAAVMALNKFITNRTKTDNMSPNARAAAEVNLKAQTAAAQTAAKRGANVDMGAIELDTFADQALEASDGLAHKNADFVPWNKLQNMTLEQMSDPSLATYMTAIQGARTAYASTLSRSGATTVEALRKADELLNAAQGFGAVKATLQQMKKEAAGIQSSSRTVQGNIVNGVTGAEHAAPNAGIDRVEHWTRDGSGKLVKVGDGK